MLEGIDIEVIIDANVLLEGVSIRVQTGEVVAILGPNGAGKSTLLRALCGDIAPTGGTVRMNGLPLADWNRQAMARVRGVLPQQSTLAFPFTVLDVALMGRSPHQHGGDSAGDRAIALAALEEAGVRHLADRFYTTLSGGEMQRVQLSRVLAQIWEPGACRYLLLDEPTAGLDLSHQHHILGVARRLATQDVAVLAVLHDLNLAAQYAYRVLMLHRGSTAAVGPPEQVLESNMVQSVFGMPVSVIPHPYMSCPLVLPLADRIVGTV